MRESPFGKTKTYSLRHPLIHIHESESLSTFKCAMKNRQWILISISVPLKCIDNKMSYICWICSGPYFICSRLLLSLDILLKQLFLLWRRQCQFFKSVYVYIFQKLSNQVDQNLLGHILRVPRIQSRRFSFINTVGMHLKMGIASNYDNHCLISQFNV